jgi:hypothetical protein
MTGNCKQGKKLHGCDLKKKFRIADIVAEPHHKNTGKF